MGKKLLWVVLVIIIAVGGFIGYFRFSFSRHPHTKSPVVARVGSAYITTEDIQKRIPAEYSDFITYEQNVDYVKRWIDSEILYQTALQRKIDLEPEVRQRLEKMRKDLLMSEMISRLCTQMADVNDADIEKYYQENSNRFLRKETEIRFSHVCVKTLAEAWRIRDRITPDNFYALGKQFSIEPMEDSLSVPYVTKAQVMPELSNIIFDIKIGGTTPPIRTPMGFYIVKILDKQMPGSVKPLKSVREEILNQISSQTQRVHLDEIIASLKKKLHVEYHLALVPGKLEAKSESESDAPSAKEAAPAPPAPVKAQPAPVLPSPVSVKEKPRPAPAPRPAAVPAPQKPAAPAPIPAPAPVSQKPSAPVPAAAPAPVPPPASPADNP
jgi:hypothetical protein